MRDPISISPVTPENEGLDYAYLKLQGTEIVQDLSGDIWTDYNEHDPGVTTLEQLSYALTELSYRAEFPLEDLLTDECTGRVDAFRQALFKPRKVFPANPLTINDYRKILVDRVPGVENAWLRPSRRSRSRGINGLYDISVYVPGYDECQTEPDRTLAGIKKNVMQVYAAHRNICEDVRAINVLRGIPVYVYGEIVIESEREVDEILATVYFDIGNFFAPELKRHSLVSKVDVGEPPSAIFNGPFLRKGLIDDNELTDKQDVFTSKEVGALIANVTGVMDVANISLIRGNGLGKSGSGDLVHVKPGEILNLVPSGRGRNTQFSILVYRNGVEVMPDPMRVRMILRRLWSEQRRTFNINAEYKSLFPGPKGRYRNPGSYYSIQNQFPRAYGIGEYGLPESVITERKAQARQFKGYLLVFDQLIADYFSQLAGVKDLFSIDAKLDRTYFFQYLNKLVPNVEPLLKKSSSEVEGGVDPVIRPRDIGYHQGLPWLVRSQDPFVERRNRFLDFLLALYAEKLSEDDLPQIGCRGSKFKAIGQRLIDAKLSLLHSLVFVSRNRGKGFDYLAASSRWNVSGAVVKIRIQLGMEANAPRPLMDVLSEYSLELAEDEQGARLGRAIFDHPPAQGRHLQPLGLGAESMESLRAEQGLVREYLRGRSISEGDMQAGCRLDNYSLGSQPGLDRYALYYRADESGSEWRLIEEFGTAQKAKAVAVGLAKGLNELCRYAQQFYIVEHILLRFSRFDSWSRRWGEENEGGPPHAPGEGFEYSFTVTAVISLCSDLVSNEQYRRFVMQVVRKNLPEHVAIEYCFISPWRMRRFEYVYYSWRKALRNQNIWQIIRSSIRLRRFIRRCSTGQ